jgi:hypothetical protein
MPVNEDEWVRCQTDEGQTYYFNRSTGASQWNLPNVFYESSMGKTRTTQSKTVKFPTEAGAMLNVNCVTEVLPRMAPAPVSEPSVSISAADVTLRNVREFRRFLDPDAQRKLNDPEFSSLMLDKFDDLDQENMASIPLDEAASVLLEVCEEFFGPEFDLPFEILGDLASRYLNDGSQIHRMEFVPFVELLVTKAYMPPS